MSQSVNYDHSVNQWFGAFAYIEDGEVRRQTEWFDTEEARQFARTGKAE